MVHTRQYRTLVGGVSLRCALTGHNGIAHIWSPLETNEIWLKASIEVSARKPSADCRHAAWREWLRFFPGPPLTAMQHSQRPQPDFASLTPYQDPRYMTHEGSFVRSCLPFVSNAVGLHDRTLLVLATVSVAIATALSVFGAQPRTSCWPPTAVPSQCSSGRHSTPHHPGPSA